MANIRFKYLYRDGGNFKSFGEVIFLNPDEIILSAIEEKIISFFLPDKQFVAHQISIPECFLFLTEKVSQYDHCFHEFDSVEICEENATDVLNRSIKDFIQNIESVSKQGWKAFDILERL